MTKFKIILVGLILSAIFITTFTSCSNNEDKTENQVSTKQVEQLLLDKFGLKKVNSNIVNLNEISIKGKSIKSENATIYQMENTDVTMILVPSIENPNLITLIKCNNVNGKFKEEKVLEVLSSLDENGNGNVSVFNSTDNYGFTSTFKNGKTTNTGFAITANGTQARTLCQRQNGESYNACFNRETAEFCDGFVATVAYITNPSIAVLIAALCSC